MTDTVAQISSLLEPFNTNGTVLSATTDISTDLNIDSVTVMDFVMEVEDHFDIEIPLNVLSETRTIGDLAKVVEARVKKDKG
ncbi:acyl carrier protein [Aestuariivirga sp.]|uniref:acyl carrier protein n=1 Tax=Aestuariivirga sp. TaxID=2650926 RepID=UPI00359488F0